jgi:hypothetical protein
MRAHVVAIMFLLTACASQPQITGPYASRLSDVDIQQIRLLVLKEPNTDHRLAAIEAIRPDKAWVKVGGLDSSGARYNRFLVLKRDGKWIVHPYSPAEIELVR